MNSNPDNPIKNSNDSLVKLLREIIDVLETSSIASEERGEGMPFKFWFAYKRLSGEYDDNMYQRCNGNMDIIMLFAGLFSAVNTAFIIAMQPNPADTTNDLLVQFMQNTWNGSSVTQPVALSAPLAYSSSKIWMQVLAYTSLTFSLLAASGAVLGKQWLNHYKPHRFDGGRLGERCQQRHRKFEELKNQSFERVLQSFPVLLQMSLILFILSLAAAMWMQHRIISLFIIVPAACGFIFFVCTVMVSLGSPDSPYQTWISFAIQRLLPTNRHVYKDSTADAMAWILDTSTNPDVISLALELMVAISNKSQDVLSPSLIKKVLGMFTACFGSKYVPSNQSAQHLLSPSLIKKVLDMFRKCVESTPLDQGNAVSFGRALIHICWKHDGATEILNKLLPKWDHWLSWRGVYLPNALERCKTSFGRMNESMEAVSADLPDQADITHTDLRMALGAGMDRFVNPDDKYEYVELVWHSQFRSELNLLDVDWLMDCAKQFMACAKPFDTTRYWEAAGDALFLFGCLKKPSSIDPASIAPFLNSSPNSLTLRHSALHAACRAVDINSPWDSSFSEGVLTAISPPTQRGHDLFANAIRLLEFHDWSQYNHGNLLEGSPFIDIQHLILLVLPAPPLQVDRLSKFEQYCRPLIHFICQDTLPDFKRVALRNAYRIRGDLATATGTPSPSFLVSLQKEAFSKLSPTLLTTVQSKSGPDYDFYSLGLIFTLANHANWLSYLDQDHYIERFIEMIPDFCDRPPSSWFYLVGIFLRASGQSAVKAITTQQWWDMTRMAWSIAGRQDNDGFDSDVLDDNIDILEALITATENHMPSDASKGDLEFLRKGISDAITKLESRQTPPPKIILTAMKDLKKTRAS